MSTSIAALPILVLLYFLAIHPHRDRSGGYARDPSMVYNLSAVLTNATALLRSNPKLTLSDLTRALGLERHTIEKAVRTLTGKSFRQWRLTLQMEQAAQILASSNLTIKETAFSLGYRSPRSFSRAFRARLRVSPAEYRRAAAGQGITLTL